MARTGWITWEVQRRNRSITQVLGLPLHEIVMPRPRYIRSAVATLTILPRYDRVVVQSPSVALAVLATGLCPRQTLIDCHSTPVEQAEAGGWIGRLSGWALRRARAVIVTNPGMQVRVERWNPNVYVLPDRIPAWAPARATQTAEVLCVRNGGPDDPVDLILSAAEQLPGIRFVLVGPVQDKPRPNIEWTGWLGPQAYRDRLGQADVVLDLTDREDALLCGAYEAVAAGKPMVLSDTLALRRYFRAGVVHTLHTPDAIAANIRYALVHQDCLQRAITEARPQMDRDWDAAAQVLAQELTPD